MSFLRYTPGAKPGVAPKRKAPEVTPPAEKRRAYEMKRKPRTFQSHWRDGRPWLMVVTDGGNPVSMFCQYCRDKCTDTESAQDKFIYDFLYIEWL